MFGQIWRFGDSAICEFRVWGSEHETAEFLHVGPSQMNLGARSGTYDAMLPYA